MAKFEKVLKGDLDDINRRLCLGISANCELTTKRGTWNSSFGDCRCIFTVFEKHAKKLWDGEQWKDQPHYSLSMLLIDTGEEIRLCAMTAGGSQELYFLPEEVGEGALMGALKIAVEMMDSII